MPIENKPTDQKTTQPIMANQPSKDSKLDPSNPTQAPKATDNPNPPVPASKGPEIPTAASDQASQATKPSLIGDHKAHQKPSSSLDIQDNSPKPPIKEELSKPLNDSSINEEEETSKQKVAFQYDRDTTLVAEVLEEYTDGTVDLVTVTNPTGHFRTNISTPATSKEYKSVRRGSKHEVGTFFDLEGLDELEVGQHVKVLSSSRVKVSKV